MKLTAHLNELSLPEAAAFRGLVERLRSLPERTPAADLTGRIMAAVDAERCRTRRRPLSPWWGFAAAALLAVTLSLVSVYRNGYRCGGSPAEGLSWLAAAQEPDGSWSPAKYGGADTYRPALTALAALALARVPDGRYAPQLQRACAALASLQAADGAFGGRGREQLYNHALTAFALATLYPGQPSLKPVLEQAVAFSRARQTVEGGWDYEPRSEGNTALTAWQVRALACASRQGFAEAQVPLRKGLRWLRGSAREDGSVAYHRNSSARSDSQAALAAYALIADGKAFPGLPELGRRVAGSLCTLPAVDECADCYRDYAKALAFESAGSGAQAEAVRRQMAARQRAGCRDQWESVGGRLYTTAFTLLASR